MTVSMPPEHTIAHFRDHGWMRVSAAFDADVAAAMRDAIWCVLAAAGIGRDRPSSWTIERPTHLQRLKDASVFRAVGGPAVVAAIKEIVGEAYETPRNWGALFLAFPTSAPWDVPRRGWHIDANYTSRLWPASGVKTHALLDDVEPRGGGTQIVSGSHRLVTKWFEDNPPPPGARGADLRKRLQSHPYIRDLHAAADSGERIARFMEQVEEVEGVPLQVIENSGRAGDVLLLHPLVLHVAAPNLSPRPRFLLSGGVTTDMWGWASAVSAPGDARP